MPKSTETEAPDLQQVVCLCAKVTRQDIVTLHKENPTADFQFMQFALGCGAQCGCCAPVVREMIGETPWHDVSVKATTISQRKTMTAQLPNLI